MYGQRSLPWWSANALRRTGLSHCLHLTMPICSLRGVEPKTFISRAESHAVGGDGRDEIWTGGASAGSAAALSQSVRMGVGDWSFLSRIVILTGRSKRVMEYNSRLFIPCTRFQCILSSSSPSLKWPSFHRRTKLVPPPNARPSSP